MVFKGFQNKYSKIFPNIEIEQRLNSFFFFSFFTIQRGGIIDYKYYEIKICFFFFSFNKDI